MKMLHSLLRDASPSSVFLEEGDQMGSENVEFRSDCSVGLSQFQVGNEIVQHTFQLLNLFITFDLVVCATHQLTQTEHHNLHWLDVDGSIRWKNVEKLLNIFLAKNCYCNKHGLILANLLQKGISEDEENVSACRKRGRGVLLALYALLVILIVIEVKTYEQAQWMVL
ncbi:hypothetical protein GCK72_017162 [Caenorhabditis remanei]|uniref:Uncharacterized protein n=1 Tax=Caenorhabditis remanei TaxID=31234 RepID=A0A6A5G6H8_CAERE|nr:hypothetical protein GCK72_017161 [Caenorhabditis remanei]XP_053580839.1 hypothetical protein GCK72_017162 [Caenorhabditis remanei]KAF1750610.1 hypothetical protein GCK72_017161 [Caenorhabditis remanei]KAF1750611.1 hypothetical protein GCK72_017162 [Caenorhabditis remanei]